MVATLMTLLLVACSSAIPAGLYVPTYGPLNAWPTALLEGTLLEEDGCLWIESRDIRWLVLWPGGSSVVEEGEQIVVRNGGERAVVGSDVSAGGGEYGPEHYDFVVGLIGEEVPAACRVAGLYWLGYDVQTVDQ